MKDVVSRNIRVNRLDPDACLWSEQQARRGRQPRALRSRRHPARTRSAREQRGAGGGQWRRRRGRRERRRGRGRRR
eukprot:452347-Hanusia_phi.AAC.1